MENGEVSAEGATIVIINKEGWFLGATHKFEVIPLLKRHRQEKETMDNNRKNFEQMNTPTATKELKKLKPDPNWITASSIWPGTDGQKIVDLEVIPEADLLLGRLDPFDASTVANYPVFKDPSKTLKAGTSLCKVGFSYTELSTKYDKEKNQFSMDFKNLVSSPLNGIYTRDIVFRTPEDAKRKFPIKFIETSSPGLRGQNGCPVVDEEGRIWGIHSRTHHLPMDTNATTDIDGKSLQIPQFLSVGWAVHPEVITGFLQERKVSFEMG
jgi:hypothetical protein